MKLKSLLAIALLFPVILTAPKKKEDEKALRDINKIYVDAWLANDEEKIMALFEEDGSITPGGAGHYKGKDKIRGFWFPKDSSVTVIEKFTNTIRYLQFEKDVAIATSNSLISWNYRKDSFNMAKDQAGYSLTFYRRQPNGGWKIWKQIWSDLWSKDR